MGKIKSIEKKEILFLMISILLFIILSLYYGYFPGVTFSSLEINYNVMGNASGSIFYDADILYPYGARQTESFGLFFICTMFNLLFNNPITAVSLGYLFVFFVSYISFFVLAKKFIKNYVMTLGVAMIFYMNPFFRGNIPMVGAGALLITFSLLLDYKIYEISQKKQIEQKEWIINIIIQFIGRLFIASISWYTGVIIAVFSCLWTLCYYVYSMWREKRIAFFIRYLSLLVFPWFIAMLLLLLATPKDTSQFTNSLEFLNSCSVSILSMLLPMRSGGQGQNIAKIIPSYTSIIPEGFTIAGDQTCCTNYIGYSLLLSAAMTLFLKPEKKGIKSAFLITTLVGLVLALGPGINLMAIIPKTDVISVDNYYLDFSRSIKLPWAELYKVFPLSIMRAVYRWILIFRVGVIIAAVFAWVNMWKHKVGKVIALFLMIIAIIEYYPYDGFLGAISVTNNNMKSLKMFDENVIEELQMVLEEDDLLAVCSYGEDANGYMISYLAERCNVKTYAGCNDKALYLSEKYKPEIINELQNEGEPLLLSFYISSAFEEGHCDAVLLPYFNIRWESYYWPPTEDVLNKYKPKVSEVKKILGEEYQIYETEYFLLIRHDEDERYDWTKNNELVKDSDPLYQKGHVLINTEKAIKCKYTLQEKDDIANYSICYNGAMEEVILAKITQLNNKGNCIKENYVCYGGTGEYVLVEDKVMLEEEAIELEVELLSIADFKIKNVSIEGYSSEDIVINNEDIMNQFIVDEKISLKEEVKINDFFVKPYINELNMKFQFYWEDNKEDVVIVSKMNGWLDEMSYSVLVKGEMLTIAFSEEGDECENYYIPETVLMEGVWNDCELTFRNGELDVIINGQNYHYVYETVQKLYGSIVPITVGVGEADVQKLTVNYQ